MQTPTLLSLTWPKYGEPFEASIEEASQISSGTSYADVAICAARPPLMSHSILKNRRPAGAHGFALGLGAPKGRIPPCCGEHNRYEKRCPRSNGRAAGRLRSTSFRVRLLGMLNMGCLLYSSLLVANSFPFGGLETTWVMILGYVESGIIDMLEGLPIRPFAADASYAAPSVLGQKT